jgi:hypothetical protein
MIQSKTKWFDKFMAGICVFCSLFLFTGIVFNHATEMRKLDGSIGLLHTPLSEAGKWAKKIFIDGVETNAQQAVRTVEGSVTNANVINLEAILNKALKQAAAALIKSFVNFIMNKFDELLKAFDAFAGVGDALRNAFGSFMAATTMWVDQQLETMGTSSEQIAVEIAPTASPEVQTALAGGVRSVALQQALNESVPANSEGLPLASGDQVKANKQTLGNVAAQANQCGSVTKEQEVKFIIYPFINNACTFDSKAQAETAVNEKASEVAAKALEKKGDIQKQSSNCQFGFLKFDSDPLPDSFASSSTFDANSSSFSISSTGPKLKSFTEQFTPESLPPDDCYAYTTGQQDATLAVPQSQANQANNEFDVNAIINEFIQAITKFFTELIQKLVNVAISAINKFLGSIPGGQYLSNALTEIAGATTQYLNNMFSQIKVDINQ